MAEWIVIITKGAQSVQRLHPHMREDAHPHCTRQLQTAAKHAMET